MHPILRRLFPFLAGALVGVIAGVWIKSRFPQRDLHLEALAGTARTCRLLKSLREGRSEPVVDGLESELDSHLLLLALEMKEKPISGWDSNHLKILVSARDYRSRFPRTNPLAKGLQDLETRLPQSAELKEMTRNASESEAAVQSALSDLFQKLDAPARP
jgi:hypothetical protein